MSTRPVESRRDHVGHVDVRVVAVVVGEHLLVAGLEPVVELLDQALFDLRHHVVGIEPAEALLQQRAEHAGVLEVGRDRLVDAGVLDLDGDRHLLAGVGMEGDRTVHLADRGGSDRIGVPVDEHLLGRPTELGLDHAGREFAATSVVRRCAAGRARSASVRAGPRRDSSPSGRASSGRPSCGRAASATASAVVRRRRSSSSTRRSVDANTLRAAVVACVPATLTPSFATLAERPAHDRRITTAAYGRVRRSRPAEPARRRWRPGHPGRHRRRIVDRVVSSIPRRSPARR